MTDWNDFIDDFVAGNWRDPATGKPASVPFETILIAESLDGGAADLVGPLGFGRRIAVVSDTNTVEAMGSRVARELKSLGAVDEIVMSGGAHCNEGSVALIRERTRHAGAVVVVGSGSLSDTVKYATFMDGRKYASFATAASMNGYAAATASVTLANGYKTSLPAHAPRGIFIDLAVNAAAPHWLSAAGLGDSLCRPTAQVDWWASHRLFGTSYSPTPFDLLKADEPLMIKSAPDLARHGIEANGHLYRVLILAGFGNCITGSSHPSSMGEHQVSHWIDMFAGARHPGVTHPRMIHGQQVGVASLAIARLHHELLALDRAPEIEPARIVEAEFCERYGPEIGRMCCAEARKKSLDAPAAAAFNRKLRQIWPQLREELRPMLMDPEAMCAALRAAGGPTTATELGLPRKVWRDAMKFARDVRNRWSFLDLAAGAGLLDDFLDRDRQ